MVSNNEKKKGSSVINQKVKELIAIGTSVGVHCEPCLKYHIRQGKAAGVSEDEILEAINIGKQVECGAIANMQNKVDQLTEVKLDKRKVAQTPSANCCKL